MTATIVVNSADPPKRFTNENVYLAFPDGLLHYDCVSCKAQCCRGHGYQLNAAREVQYQLRANPTVRFFVNPCDAHAAHYHVSNAAPSCFFLTSDDRCGIQVQHGFDAKPSTCRFFPFNGLFVVDRYLVVHPHLSLCPIEVVAGGQRSACSNHESILDVMASYGIDQHVHERQPVVGVNTGLIVLEKAIRQLSEQHFASGSFTAFAAAQCALTAATIGNVNRNGSAEPAMADINADCEGLSSEIEDTLGVSERIPVDQSITRAVIAMTPSLRALLVFRRREDVTPQLELSMIPRFLLALHSMAQLAARAGMPSVSYQAVMRIAHDHAWLLHLLGELRSVIAWKPDATVNLAFGGTDQWQRSYARIARALLPRVQQAARVPLGQVLRENLPVDGFERVLLLKRLAVRLMPHVSPLQRCGRWARFGRSPRAGVQQLLIESVPSHVLTSFALNLNRRSTRRATRTVTSTAE